MVTPSEIRDALDVLRRLLPPGEYEQLEAQVNANALVLRRADALNARSIREHPTRKTRDP